MSRFFIATALIFLIAPASADIYKCRLPNGKTEIANIPCPTGSGTVTVRPDEHVSEASRRAAEQDVERMRTYVEKREAVQRADEAAEREERAASLRQQNTVSRAPRQYGSAEECLRDIEQTPMEAGERARMEADCRSIVRPQPVYVPVVVPAYPQHSRPHHVHPRPAPKPEPPSAPQIAVQPRKK